MTTFNPRSWLLCVLFAVSCISLSVQAQNKGQQTPPITLENVSYGAHKNQIFDFWKADVKEPAPLAIYIHGGGFKTGSHDKLWGNYVKTFLDAGVHHISIEYRFLQHAMFPAPHQDVQRALQFIRSKADEWGIDTNRIAAYGGSAGAQLAAYLAWHDDLADPHSDDPIARESSRLTAVAAKGVQSTMDLNWWFENLPGYSKSFHKDFWQPKQDNPMLRAGARQLMDKLSVINLISADDPPTLLIYKSNPSDPIPNQSPKALKGWVTHHVNFGIALEKELKAKGVEVHLDYPKKKAAFGDDIPQFLLHHLKQ